MQNNKPKERKDDFNHRHIENALKYADRISIDTSPDPHGRSICQKCDSVCYSVIYWVSYTNKGSKKQYDFEICSDCLNIYWITTKFKFEEIITNITKSPSYLDKLYNGEISENGDHHSVWDCGHRDHYPVNVEVDIQDEFTNRLTNKKIKIPRGLTICRKCQEKMLPLLKVKEFKSSYSGD